MLNPDGPTPDAKKKALKKKLGGDVPFPNPPQKEDASTRANDKVIAKSIDRQVAPPPNKPAYKPTADLHLSKDGPHNVFNPKAQVDNSQIIDRVPDFMDSFISHLANTKSGNFKISWTRHQLDKLDKNGNTLPQYKAKGTPSKEALLARLRNKK